MKEGYTELGFAGGMAVPAVIRFGYGFIQGADAAAQELGVNANVKFWFADSFAPSDDIKTKAASWYTEGTEVIFSCGGGICTSIIAAAEEGGGKVIGVDSDQYYLSDVVITSAMKDLPTSVQLSLTACTTTAAPGPRTTQASPRPSARRRTAWACPLRITPGALRTSPSTSITSCTPKCSPARSRSATLPTLCPRRSTSPWTIRPDRFMPQWGCLLGDSPFKFRITDEGEAR